MQTFITSISSSECARNLDDSRLNKQLLEAIQIYQINFNEGILDSFEPFDDYTSVSWYNHPAIEMWRFSPNRLLLYIKSMASEYMVRKRTTNMVTKALSFYCNHFDDFHSFNEDAPLDCPEVIHSHQKALLVKSFVTSYCSLVSFSLNVEMRDAAATIIDFDYSLMHYYRFFDLRLFDIDSLTKNAERYAKSKVIISNPNVVRSRIEIFRNYDRYFRDDYQYYSSPIIDLNYFWPTRK